jgi:chromosomal replication initiation ATPase DnaA
MAQQAKEAAEAAEKRKTEAAARLDRIRAQLDEEQKRVELEVIECRKIDEAAQIEAATLLDLYRTTEVLPIPEHSERLRGVPGWIAALAAVIATKHGTTPREIAGTGRRKNICAARFELWYEIKKRNPKLTLPKIGGWFDRDHTSVLNGISKHATRNGLDSAYNGNKRRTKHVDSQPSDG